VIVRGKALALVLEAAVVTDESGNAVDIKALSAELDGGVLTSSSTTTRV